MTVHALKKKFEETCKKKVWKILLLSAQKGNVTPETNPESRKLKAERHYLSHKLLTLLFFPPPKRLGSLNLGPRNCQVPKKNVFRKALLQPTKTTFD